MHGFDEFFGNLYHLNAEEEPELPDYPKDPEFKKKYGPRGVLHCIADGKGGQKITDTGPLTKKRMETIDEEITDRAIEWMEKQVKADQPFFMWYNSTAMHFRTHLADKNRGKSGQDDYSDRMFVHDEQIGQILDKLDELGIADNTFIMYSTDNGPENDTWPDGANTPFRSQKDTNWEGGWRVPCLMRWPGQIKPGSVLNGIASHIDMFPTLLAMAGNPDVTKQLLDGATVGDKTFKVHLDGYNLIPYLTGEAKESPRNWIMYFSDDGEVMAVRVGDYKFVLGEQRATSTQVWAEPLVKLRVPMIFHLRRDPFERAQHNSNVYYDWLIDHVPQTYLMQEVVAQQLADFAKFPPRQKPAAFNLDAVMAQVSAVPVPHNGEGAANAKTKAKTKGSGSGATPPPAKVAAKGPPASGSDWPDPIRRASCSSSSPTGRSPTRWIRTAEEPAPVADEAEAPEESDGPTPIPVASALLARAAALPPSEWASLGPDVVFGWVARLKPADVLHLGRVVGEMLAAGSSPDVERGFGLAWTGGVRIPRPELDVMLEEFTDLEITVGRILGGGELGATYRPEARSGLASWFGDWMPRTRPGETQAAGVIERNGAPGRRGLVALWNVWMAMRYRELIPAPTFELLVQPWVTVIGRLPEPA